VTFAEDDGKTKPACTGGSAVAEKAVPYDRRD
jgi:hypothetical protein